MLRTIGKGDVSSTRGNPTYAAGCWFLHPSSIGADPWQKVRADHAARLVPAAAWQTAPAGHGSKGERDYGWAWLATASARHQLLIRRNLRDPADLAYFLCHVPAGRACSFTTLVRVAGRRWPVEEDFALGKSWFGLADSQVRRYTAITRHLALAMAAPPPGQSPVVPPASPAADQRSRSMIRSPRTPPQKMDSTRSDAR